MSRQLWLSMWFGKSSRRMRRGDPRIKPGRVRPPAVVHHLERRLMLSANGESASAAGIANTPPFVLFGRGALGEQNVPDVSSPYAPSDLRQAYGVTQISLGGVAGDGSGQAIAIIDAYNDPNIISDANNFSLNYGLPQFNQSGGPTLQVVNESGQSSPLPANASAGGWDVEESLDVEWAHSMAPKANIILVEANSSSSSDLYPAAHMAAGLAGVSVVSMSFGGGESQTEQTFDSDFTTPSGHQGVTFLASSGDSGAPGGYPAMSPNVVAVGGTDLSINSNGSYGSESGWSDSGGGVSAYESQPSYQSGEVNGASTTNRSIPDVSMNAGVGVSVLDTYYSSSYLDVGGTSVACPMWAGLVAMADQGRVLQGEGTLNGRTQTLPDLYSLPGTDFHDITSGNNGYAAGVGYDLVTGIGSPVANLLVPALAGYSAPLITTNPGNLNLTAGQNATFTAAASGNPTPTVQWMVETAGSSSFTTISGATSTTLNLGAATVTESGNKYEAVFTNGVGTPATTTAATLTVNAASTGSLTGSQATAASSYNLTTLGTADWAHWGRGGTYGNFDHKASGASQISNVTQLGTGGSYGGYTDSSRDVIWSDGTPTSTDSGDDGYIWANTALGAGYSFTVPADTTTRTLYVYAGGYSSGGTLTAHLSDGSAADYVASASGTGIYSNLYTLTYTAASAGQTLKISYVKSTNINGTGGSVDLIGAWLIGQKASTAPAITSNPANLTVTVGQAATFTATASGNPTPTVQWMVETSGGTSFSAVSGATSTTLNLGAATLAESGNKYEAVFSNGVNPSATSNAATLTVNPLPSGGSLSGVPSTPAASYNLTTLGTSDWAHWGLGGSASAFDHKATGGSQISNVTTVGTGSFGGYTDPSRGVSWTDGTPVASDAGDDGYIWANNGIGAGYAFTVPASTTTQTLYVYLGGYSSGGTLTAHLSDGSAPDYTANLSGSALYTSLIAITYNAASAGQTLTLTYTKSTNINGTGGSVDLIAAWLAGPAASTAPSITANPANLSVTVGATATFTAAASGNPTPTVQWMVEASGGTSFSQISGATSTTLNLGAATLAENGNKYEAVFSNGVGSPATTTAATLTVTAASTGSLTGAQAAAASSYNLTTLGTADWAHWGRGGVYGNFDHKATGASQISNVTQLGTGGNYGGYSDNSRNATWTDGTPTVSDTNEHGYIWANTALGAGYSFTVPADTTTRTLYVYAGGYSSGGTLTAHLSDGSAADYVVSASGTGIYSNFYTITYTAASAGQTLKISYVKSTNINGTGGSVDLIAAALT